MQFQTTVESMSRFIKDMNDKGMAGLAAEYRKIDDEDSPSGSHKAFMMNMAKNRYSGKLLEIFFFKISMGWNYFLRILSLNSNCFAHISLREFVGKLLLYSNVWIQTA